MSVYLPIYQSIPTVAQLKSTDHLGSFSMSNYQSQAANNYLYIARTTDYSGYSSILDGTYNPSYTYNYCYIIFAKSNQNIVRWVYFQSDGERVATVSPWPRRIITYNGQQYAVVTPWTASDNPTETTGCWANCPVYSSISDFFATEHPIPYTDTAYPITYRLTNCTAPSAPIEAVTGDTVTVPLQFTDGYGIVNPSSDVYVTNNGVIVPSSYTNGTLTFTMPDLS